MVRLFLVFGLLLGFLGNPAFGCSCAFDSGCLRVKMHDAMFTGKVLAVKTVERRTASIRFPVQRRVFTFEVEEGFAGGFRTGDSVDIETGRGGGDCGYPFFVGQAYLVDAYREETGLQTGICTATTPEHLAVNTVRELRAAIAGGSVPDLSGIVQRLREKEQPQTLAGISVTLTGVDGQQRNVFTDAAGAYSFMDLPEGKYTIAADLPSDLATWADESGKPQEVNIPSRAKRENAACHVSVIGMLKNGISGIVVDDVTRPLTGTISAFPVAWNDAWGPVKTQTIHEDGSFRFLFLGPGEYKLQVVQPNAKGGKRWFFPSGQSKADATPVRVEPGRMTEGLRFIVSYGASPDGQH